MIYKLNQDNRRRTTEWDSKTEKAYLELAKFISEKYSLSIGKLKVGLKKYGLSGLFEKPEEFGLSEDQRNELELIYILSTKNLHDFDEAVN